MCCNAILVVWANAALREYSLKHYLLLCLHALGSGCKVLAAVDGKRVKISAGGTQRVIKTLPKHTPVVLGSKRGGDGKNE